MTMLAVGVWLAIPMTAKAQVTPPPVSSPPSAAAMMANPYMNPYLNPYLNPVVGQLNPYGPTAGARTITPGTAGLLMYQANVANGGIGSGRISGTRPLPGTRQKAAVMPDSSSMPGAGAAKYFNPGVGNARGAGRYFGRSGSYFMNNRR